MVVCGPEATNSDQSTADVPLNEYVVVPKCRDTVIIFGQYKKKVYGAIVRHHPEYIDCCREQRRPSMYMARMLEWVDVPNLPKSNSSALPSTHVRTCSIRACTNSQEDRRTSRDRGGANKQTKTVIPQVTLED